MNTHLLSGGRKINTLYLVSLDEIQYKEVFKGFRFYALNNAYQYVDFESKEYLVNIEGKLTLMKYSNPLTHYYGKKKLCFGNKGYRF